MNFFTRKTLSAVVIIVMLIVVYKATQYRSYVYARVWHYNHGDRVSIGEHEIELPGLWWAEKINNAGWISIMRASKSTAFVESKILVSTAISGVAAENDDEQLRLVSKVVSGINHGPQPGWTYSVMTLQAKNSIWYCIRSTEVVLGQHISTGLNCNSSRIPYSLMFGGPPEQENEAKQIIATFQ